MAFELDEIPFQPNSDNQRELTIEDFVEALKKANAAFEEADSRAHNFKARAEKLEAENTVLNRKLFLTNQYVGYLQAALEEIGSWSSASLNRARVKKVMARVFGYKPDADTVVPTSESK